MCAICLRHLIARGSITVIFEEAVLSYATDACITTLHLPEPTSLVRSYQQNKSIQLLERKFLSCLIKVSSIQKFCGLHEVSVETCEYLQLDGFVPVDDVARQHEGLDVNHVDVSTFRADVQPFALQWQVDVRNPVTRHDIKTQLLISL